MINKAVLTAVLIVLVLGTGLAMASEQEDEQLLLQEKALKAIGRNDVELDSIAERLKGQSLESTVLPASEKHSVSTFTNGLAQLKNTTWVFTYKLGSSYTDTITFGSTIREGSGSTYLSCSNQYRKQGAAILKDSYFTVGIMGTFINRYYHFKINGDTASGKYFHESISTGNYSSFYSLHGVKTSGPAFYTYYRDNDKDGYGDPKSSREASSRPSGYVTNNSDCNDWDTSIYPGAPEVPGDGIDQDCNGFDEIDKQSFNNHYYLPAFKSPPTHWSGLAMTNLSYSSSATVLVTVYGRHGDVLTSDQDTVPAAGQKSFLVGKTLTGDGWIKISSNQPLAGLNWLVKDEITGSYMASVPFSSTLSTSLVIPHVDQSASWDETIFLANPNASSATVALTYTDKNGKASPPYTKSIQANGSTEIGLDLIAGSAGSGGSVSISSSQGLAGFALFDNLKTGGNSYAGINAVDVSVLDEKP